MQDTGLCSSEGQVHVDKERSLACGWNRRHLASLGAIENVKNGQLCYTGSIHGSSPMDRTEIPTK